MPACLPGALSELLPRIAASELASPDTYPAASIDLLYEANLVGAPFPADHGGTGSTLRDSVLTIEALAAASPSVALVASMPLGLAGVLTAGLDVVPPAHRARFSEQTERVSADYRARKVYAACNSEQGAGGSLAATHTTATRRPDGAFGIAGEKILATSGRYASTFFSTAKVTQEDVPGGGIVEFFFVDTAASGVEILDDWDGFGMRPTESHTVRYHDATAREMLGFPAYLDVVQPLQYWFCLFAAIPLGCARAVLRALGSPAPRSAALRLRLSEATMRYEAMRAYLLETADGFRAAAGREYAARALRTKTFVSQESTRLCAELFALGGGRNYRRNSPVARALADSFAGTSLRPPLALALDTLVEEFSIGDAE